MSAILYRGVGFPKLIVQHATWLHVRFTLSLRDVAGLLAERGIIVTYETIRVWVARFGPLIARRLRQHSSSPAEPLLQFNPCGAAGSEPHETG